MGPDVQQHGISEQEFVTFIDTLDVVAAASPYLKVLDLIGGFVGMVPHHWAQVASSVMGLAAMGGTATMSKSRTDTFLSEMNGSHFSPRRLRVRLVTTDAWLATIQFPLGKTVALPLNATLPPDQRPSFHARPLLGLRGYVGDTVPTDLRPRNAKDNLLDKMSAEQVQRDVKKIDRKILQKSEKEMKRRKKKKKGLSQLDSDSQDAWDPDEDSSTITAAVAWTASCERWNVKSKRSTERPRRGSVQEGNLRTVSKRRADKRFLRC